MILYGTATQEINMVKCWNFSRENSVGSDPYFVIKTSVLGMKF